MRQPVLTFQHDDRVQEAEASMQMLDLNPMGSSEATVEILLVDEHLIFREGLRKLLEGEPDFSVIGDASDAEEAVRAALDLKPDVLIAGLSGRPLIRMMQTLHEAAGSANHQIRTIVLAVSIEKTHIAQALQLGVSGILPKETTSQMLFESVRTVAGGDCWIGRERLADLVETMRHPPASTERQVRKARFGLTPRELEIVAAVRRGETNKAIARRFSITEDTVKHHLTRIFDKIGVFTRLELAIFAINFNLVQDSESAAS